MHARSSTGVEPAEAPDPAAAAAPDRRPRPSVVGVLGEILLTLGVVVLLFLAWQLWWNDAILAGSQTSAARDLSREWDASEPSSSSPPTAEPASPAAAAPDYGLPVVASAPDHLDVLGNLWVPRFGSDYVRTIAQGTSTDVLNSTRLGIGHYDDTQMPGEVGNFAIAAHRSAYGGGMHLIDQLQVGDPIVIETADGWYVYRFTNLEYVLASAVDVLAPVPQHPGATPGDRIITLTTCNPLYSTAERVAAYGVFESWQPRSAGPPAVVADIVAASGVQ
ncbi:class E sortase [Naasia lichenicola]|uniref:Class E sortase n=1 Tax=Naasia lichenicola TaxID=2565933 RepID=A0A4S4FGQ3_9MICO|nr:class E sortase [Naasia lichenicola]THG29450.1 class E sortase [Naasia lichenicola]